MKTIKEFIKEIDGSVDLQNELTAVKDKDGLETLLKKHDVSATVEEFVKAVKELSDAEGEIGDDAAEAAAGGRAFYEKVWKGFTTIIEVVSLL